MVRTTVSLDAGLPVLFATVLLAVLSLHRREPPSLSLKYRPHQVQRHVRACLEVEHRRQMVYGSAVSWGSCAQDWLWWVMRKTAVVGVFVVDWMELARATKFFCVFGEVHPCSNLQLYEYGFECVGLEKLFGGHVDSDVHRRAPTRLSSRHSRAAEAGAFRRKMTSPASTLRGSYVPMIPLTTSDML